MPIAFITLKMVSLLAWTISDASWTGSGFRVYFLPQIPIREALGESAPTLMPWQKPKNSSQLLLNILNIPLLKLNLGLSPNLTYPGFNLATKRHHLRR
jgi:hypothetical protein